MGQTIRRGGNDRETEFSQPQCLCGKFDRRRNAQTRGKVQQADLRGYVHTRHIESLLVRISSRVYVIDISVYRDKCKIMYTDTNSPIYHIECDDVYKNMKRDIVRFDERLSGRQRVWYASRQQKSTGLMKDENNGAIMTEFVGVRAKMYAVRVNGKKDIKKVKGVKNNVVARTITFDDYTRCLNEEIEMTRHQSCIRSKLHDIRIENRSESIQ